MKANAKDICESEAKGAGKVSRAELEEQYKPSTRNAEKLKDARADAAYDLAKERCDDQQGNDKKACVEQAKATHTSAKAQAKASKASADAIESDKRSVVPGPSSGGVTMPGTAGSTTSGSKP